MNPYAAFEETVKDLPHEQRMRITKAVFDLDAGWTERALYAGRWRDRWHEAAAYYRTAAKVGPGDVDDILTIADEVAAAVDKGKYIIEAVRYGLWLAFGRGTQRGQDVERERCAKLVEALQGQGHTFATALEAQDLFAIAVERIRKVPP